MSYQNESTFQEQMAGPSRSRFTGWLTMAPEVDPAPPPSIAPSSTQSTLLHQSQPSRPPHSFTSTFSEQPVASTHGFGYLGQNFELPQRSKPRPTFQVGSPALSEHESHSSSSRRSSRASSDAPEFDVRASFAPMPVYANSKTAAQPSTYRGVGTHNRASFAPQPAHNTDNPNAAIPMHTSSHDEADGLSFGGRRWKGKTVHAVEQELEALRDERLMSHAPDAAYLASRLEGVRRNLEIEERRPSYVPYDEDFLTDQEEAALPPEVSEVVRQLYPFQHIDATTRVASTAQHRPVSNASSVSLVEGETPHDLDFGLQFDPSASCKAPCHDVQVNDPNDVSMPPVSDPLVPSHAKHIHPAARAAALDARIDVRALRRGDLEQVRDLHAFHGDSDRSPDHGETYASTASFLLRLLVDDRHVCLVAVAKPIPEPANPLPDLATSRNLDLPVSPRSASSGVASPSSSPSIDALESLGLATVQVAEAESSEGLSSLSCSPVPSLFSVTEGGRVPAAPQTRMISPRAHDGKINNTPATSVFSDIFAERGVPGPKSSLPDLPGPTDTASAPFKKVLSVPPPRGTEARAAETETILGVVSAQLSVVSAPSEDSLFPASKKGGDRAEEASSVVDIHLLTLATAPEERGQGLGAKLLSALHAECMVKARLMAMRMRTKIPGPLPTVAPLSPKFIDEAALPSVPASSEPAMRPQYLQSLGCSLAELRDALPASGRFLTRTYLEVHPSNVHALALYRAHGFTAPHDDTKAVKRGFYRGDVRIATRERTKSGGTDAWMLQRFDGVLSTAS